MRVVFLINNRATMGRTKALYDAVKVNHEAVAVLGCGAWNSKDIETDHRIQAVYRTDDNEGMFLTGMSYGTQLISHLRQLNPDVVFVHGDRYEQLVGAMACAYLNIPLWHTEGGDESGSIDNKVRNSITMLADKHFPISAESCRRLLDFVRADDVHMVGSVGIDLVRKWEDSNPPEIPELNFPYVLVLHHPDTVTHESIEPLISAVLEACGSYKIIWVNPNEDPGSREMLKKIHASGVGFVKNLPNEQFFTLMKGAACLIGNSSAFIKEACYLGKPSVIVGSRQRGREMGHNCIRVKSEKDVIVSAIRFALESKCEREDRFGNGYACERILAVLDNYKTGSKHGV